MKQLNEFTLTDRNESITVPATIDGIAEGLEFKAKHIKAKADPAFFEEASNTIRFMKLKIAIQKVKIDMLTEESN